MTIGHQLPNTNSRHPRALWKFGIGSWVLILAVSAGCGKKGPPLPPFVRVPAAVSQFTARRVGDDVILNLALPAQNMDQSTPVNLGRVDVYGYTGRTAPPAPRFTEVAQLVGKIEAAPGAAPVTIATIVRDSLTSEKLVEGPPLARTTPATKTAPPPKQDPYAPLKRYYMAVAFSERGRPGPPSPVVEVPLTSLPDAPTDVRATYNADAVTLSWEPSGGLLGFLFDRLPMPSTSPLDDGPPVTVPGTLPAGPPRYSVYRETEPAPDSAPPAEKTAPPGRVLLTPTPVAGLSFNDPLKSDGRRQCYAVSAVRGQGESIVEGHPSMPVCVTTVDVFPPVPPTGVSPIAVEGAISLVWEPNSERDLAGYSVWRGEEGSETLTTITDDVVKETRYTDQNVKPGVRYVYAITAVDSQSPKPNVSAQSERVEITAR